MENTKVLFISQEITPYLPESNISNIGRYLPQGIQESGREIRTFMPKYGCINERRNQLHEVIRLSGMNLIIDDTDHPLIIKVASIQAARMQVYFIDNEDYFQRKFTLKDENGISFEDNDERAIFFARGVVETVKKLRWKPDIVHCHGWFTGLVPLYLKKAYNEEPLFADSKLVYSVYDDSFDKDFNEDFKDKVLYEGVTKKDVKLLEKPDYLNINKLAVDNSDALILGNETINPELEKYIKSSKKPVLEYQNPEEYVKAYSDFYDKIL
ncbi:MAG: glycogen/starch synthase [Bacteroidota bacterium]|nr:glycogen/starch synthase [Bacteroidota bacterium]